MGPPTDGLKTRTSVSAPSSQHGDPNRVALVDRCRAAVAGNQLATVLCRDSGDHASYAAPPDTSLAGREAMNAR